MLVVVQVFGWIPARNSPVTKRAEEWVLYAPYIHSIYTHSVWLGRKNDDGLYKYDYTGKQKIKRVFWLKNTSRGNRWPVKV